MKNLILPCCLLFAPFVRGDNLTVFSNNFDTYEIGVLPLAYAQDGWSPQKPPQVVDDGQTLFARVVQDTQKLFRMSTDNRCLRIADTSNANGDRSLGAYNFVLSTSTNAFASGSTQVGTLSFDFYESKLENAQGNGWLLRFGNGWASNPNTVFALLVGKGAIRQIVGPHNVLGATLGSYSPGTLQTLTVVFNSSAAEVAYGGGTLAAGHVDIWLGSNRVGTGLPASGGKGGELVLGKAQPVDNFNFTRNPTTEDPAQDFIGELYLDNIVLTNTASAPVGEGR